MNLVDNLKGTIYEHTEKGNRERLSNLSNEDLIELIKKDPTSDTATFALEELTERSKQNRESENEAFLKLIESLIETLKEANN